MPVTLSSSETELGQRYTLLVTKPVSVNRKCRPKVGLLLGQRRRHWCNIKPASGQYPMYAGIRLAILFSQAVSGHPSKHDTLKQ